MRKRPLKYARNALMTIMAVAALVLALSGTANADSPWVYTDDPAPGGKAKFYSNGVGGIGIEEVRVCDLEADGQAAYVDVWDSDSNNVDPEMSVRAGGKGTCATDSYNIPEGHEVMLQVHLSEGFLNYWIGRA
jgi:hypothetical protein